MSRGFAIGFYAGAMWGMFGMRFFAPASDGSFWASFAVFAFFFIMTASFELGRRRA